MFTTIGLDQDNEKKERNKGCEHIVSYRLAEVQALQRAWLPLKHLDESQAPSLSSFDTSSQNQPALYRTSLS